MDTKEFDLILNQKQKKLKIVFTAFHLW